LIKQSMKSSARQVT